MLKRVLAISVVAAGLAVVGFVMVPAQADVNAVNKIRNSVTNNGGGSMCLDGNGEGKVYALNCGDSRNQVWSVEFWETLAGTVVRIRNTAPGASHLCLDGNGHHEVYMLPCGPSENQKWTRFEFPFGVKYQNAATTFWLDSNDRGEVYAIEGNSGGNQVWYEDRV